MTDLCPSPLSTLSCKGVRPRSHTLPRAAHTDTYPGRRSSPFVCVLCIHYSSVSSRCQAPRLLSVLQLLKQRRRRTVAPLDRDLQRGAARRIARRRLEPQARLAAALDEQAQRTHPSHVCDEVQGGGAVGSGRGEVRRAEVRQEELEERRLVPRAELVVRREPKRVPARRLHAAAGEEPRHLGLVARPLDELAESG
eukprot:CAMPEP_0196693500 /NCGR_PEP_ID=MMETSP1090-20130531/30704_2 /TAXON_ID=37098 /ORGANISM="Isochrysis sp, Strain CCMP1244" /LENGTH=195 /DNA_ID=CAMNT_0042032935 /DNA_START=156 /DNA_END=740 /DNA_ORIENTATION=-